ncbi:MAG: hypothetical protein KDE27_02850 [Planctomycetes bacterium]|nr:hypothetical protein [Planctomycetota bacterium]
MTLRLIGSLILLFAAGSLGAQDPATGKPATGTPATGNPAAGTNGGDAGAGRQCDRDAERINRRAQQMREQLGTGKAIKSHVKVQVRLNNGNRLEGVVKDGRLVEKVTGLRFEDAHAKDKGAGIRLWYTGGTRNYVFVPFAELQSYRVLQRLTQKQLAELELELQMKETQRLEGGQRRPGRDEPAKAGDTPAAPEGEALPPGLPPGLPDPRRAAADRQDSRDGGAKTDAEAKADSTGSQTSASKTAAAKTSGGKTGKTTGTDTADADAAAKEQQRAWFKLLQDYPPESGWSKAKCDEISRRFTVVGARPSEHEQRFVDKFAEWEKACEHFGVESKGEAEGSGSTGRRGRKK